MTLLNRKTFLRRLGAGAAGLAAVGAGGADSARAVGGSATASSSFGPLVFDPADPSKLWSQVRAQYTFKEGLTYFNCGGLGPSPRHVLQVYDETASSLQRTVETGHPLFEDARQALATFLGAELDEVCFTRNATEGNSIIAAGLDLKAGDEVIFESHAHPGGSLPWLNQARQRGVVVKVFKPDPTSAAGNLERLKAQVTARTRVIQVSHITAPTGIIMPVREIAAFVRGRGIWFHVDGAQSAGMIPIDLHGLGCDSYATSGHKWLGGPRETGVLYIRSAGMEQVAPSHVGSYSSGDFDFQGQLIFSKGARRYEYGTRNAAAVVALAEAARFQQSIGRERIAEYGRAMGQRLQGGLTDLRKVTVLTPTAPELRASMTTFTVEGRKCEAVFDALFKQHGLRCRPVTEDGLDAVRVSTHVFNTPEQCDRLAAALKAYVAQI